MTEPAQPPPSWAELTSRLEGLLQRLEAGCSSQQAEDLLQECIDWREDVDNAEEAAAEGQPPGPGQRKKLIRKLLRAGERLAALDRRRGVWRILPAACELLAGCSELAEVCSMEGGNVSRYAACLTLVLNRGTPALLASAPHTSEAARQACEDMLCSQALALQYTFSLIDSASAAVAGRIAPPSSLLSWLAAAAGAFKALERARGSPGKEEDTDVDDGLASVAQLLYSITGSSTFVAHEAALHEDAALCASLLRVLLPHLAALAAELQQPKEPPPSDDDWGHPATAAAAMVGLCTNSADLAEPSDMLQLLQLAAQLAARAPPGDEQLDCLHLLGAAASAYRAYVLPRPELQLPAEQAAHLLQLLPPALARFAQALSAADEDWQGTLVWCFEAQTQLLVALARSQPKEPSVDGMRACCAGATAALRVLAPLAPLASPPGDQQPDPELKEGAADAMKAARELARVAAEVATQASAAIEASSPAAAAATAAFSALWQLHSVLCRAVHAGAPGARGVLVNAASRVLLAASRLTGTAADTARPLAAMSAAHFELLRAALLDAPGAAATATAARAAAYDDDLLGLAAAAAAVNCGPAALAAHPGAGALFARLAQSLPQMNRNLAAHLVSMLREPAGAAPAAAHLLHCGALDWMVQSALRAPNRPEAELALRLVVNALEAACSAGEAASAASGNAADASSRELAAGLEQPTAALRAALTAPAFASVATALSLRPGEARSLLNALQMQLLPSTRQLAAALLQWWRRPEQAAADALELARAAAARSCAYLRCANLAGEGGPAAREGVGSSRCSACRAVWYCNEACSHTDWRGGPSGDRHAAHRRVCRTLGTERAAAKAAAAAQRCQAGGAGGGSSGGAP